MSTSVKDKPTILDGLASLMRADEPLARHTTMRVGGPARWWVEPQNEDQVETALQIIRRAGLRLQVLGAGSNLVPHDVGFEGVVLSLGKGLAYQRVEGDRLIAGGAAKLPKLTHFAIENRLGNFEWACGIPGSLGGSIWGNAGARGFNGRDFESRDCAADLESLVAFERSGKRHILGRNDIDFAYRRSSLGEMIVTEATFKLKPLDEMQQAEHRAVVKDLLARRKATQPVNAASAGCVWKNPKVEGCQSAGALVEQLGLKNQREGGAVVSEVHGNFVINTGTATGDDVRKLIARIEDRVLQEVGIQLEREVRLLEP